MDKEISLHYVTWSAKQFAIWLKGTSPEFSSIDLNIPDEWSGKFLETLSNSALASFGLQNYEQQKIVLQNVSGLIEQFDHMESETLQTVVLRVLCSATSLRQGILKRIRVMDQLKQIQQMPTNEVNQEMRDKNATISKVLQRDATRLEKDFSSCIESLLKSMDYITHWLKRPPFNGSPTPVNLSSLQESCLEAKSSLHQYITKSAPAHVKLITAKTQLENMERECNEFIQQCRDSLYITPYRLERFHLLKDKASPTFGLDLGIAPNGTAFICGIIKKSAASESDRIGEGDEIIQINDQVVVCWSLEAVNELIAKCQREIRILLRRRPMHTNEVQGGYKDLQRPRQRFPLVGKGGGSHNTLSPIIGGGSPGSPFYQSNIAEVSDSSGAASPSLSARNYRMARRNQGGPPAGAVGNNHSRTTLPQHILQYQMSSSPSTQRSSLSPSEKVICRSVPDTPLMQKSNNAKNQNYDNKEETEKLTNYAQMHDTDPNIEIGYPTLPTLTTSESGASLAMSESKMESSIDDLGLAGRAPRVESESCDSTGTEESYSPHKKADKGRPKSSDRALSPHALMDNKTNTVQMRNTLSPGSGNKMNRRISCKDLGKGDCEGWLCLKKSNRITSVWVRRWCVLKNRNLYYYLDQNAIRAEGLLSIPGFKVTPSTENKSGRYTFRLYNDYVSFVFASETLQGRTKWMNKLGLMAICVRVSTTDRIAGFHEPYSLRPTGMIVPLSNSPKKVMRGIGSDAVTRSQIGESSPVQPGYFSESDDELEHSENVHTPLRAASNAFGTPVSSSSSDSDLQSLSPEELSGLHKLENGITLLEEVELIQRKITEKQEKIEKIDSVITKEDNPPQCREVLQILLKEEPDILSSV